MSDIERSQSSSEAETVYRRQTSSDSLQCLQAAVPIIGFLPAYRQSSQSRQDGGQVVGSRSPVPGQIQVLTNVLFMRFESINGG